MADIDGITLAKTAFTKQRYPRPVSQLPPVQRIGQRGQPDPWARAGFADLAATVRHLYTACGWTEGLESNLAHSLAIVGSHDGDGSSSISWALAIAAAHDFVGEVVLVECDLHHPTFRKDLGLREGPGLSQLLASGETEVLDIDAHLCATRMMNLRVLPAGNAPENPSRLLRSPRMADVLMNLREHFSFVILNLPSVLRNSEAATVAQLVDSTVVVIRAGTIDERTAQQTIDLLVGANVRGAILNRWHPTTPSALRRLVAS